MFTCVHYCFPIFDWLRFKHSAVMFKAAWCSACTVFNSVYVLNAVSFAYSKRFVFSCFESISLMKMMKGTTDNRFLRKAEANFS